jgi:hypothetical protein
MKKLILLLIVITALTVSCKKYPDGPLISFRTAKGRLYGFHTLTKYTVNGVDSLSRYQDSLCTTFNFNHHDDDGKDYCSMAGSRKDGWESTLSWTWVLEDKNKDLLVTLSGGNPHGRMCTGPFGDNICPAWQILKLYWNDIIMQTTYNGKVYLIELTGG